MCGWIYGCIFFSVLLLYKKARKTISLGMFLQLNTARFSTAKYRNFFFLNKQKSRSRERVLGTCLLDHHGWEFYGDHNACDHASVHGTAM